MSTFISSFIKGLTDPDNDDWFRPQLHDFWKSYANANANADEEIVELLVTHIQEHGEASDPHLLISFDLLHDVVGREVHIVLPRVLSVFMPYMLDERRQRGALGTNAELTSLTLYFPFLVDAMGYSVEDAMYTMSHKLMVARNRARHRILPLIKGLAVSSSMGWPMPPKEIDYFFK
jgi:hypothetical protein